MNNAQLRKAAILIDSLDTARADALLEQMPEQVRSVIRSLVVELDDVADEEREQVINEFIKPESNPGTAPQVKAASTDSEEQVRTPPLGMKADEVSASQASSTAPEVATRFDPSNDNPMQATPIEVHDPPLAASESDRSYSSLDPVSDAEAEESNSGFRPIRHTDRTAEEKDKISRPTERRNQREFGRDYFSFVRLKDAPRFARCLQLENPQAVATVIATMPAQIAADVCASMRSDVRREVLSRLADTSHVDHQVIRELESYFFQRFSEFEIDEEASEPELGFLALQSILDNVDESERKQMLSSLFDDRPDLAKQLSDYYRQRTDVGELSADFEQDPAPATWNRQHRQAAMQKPPAERQSHDSDQREAPAPSSPSSHSVSNWEEEDRGSLLEEYGNAKRATSHDQKPSEGRDSNEDNAIEFHDSSTHQQSTSTEDQGNSPHEAEQALPPATLKRMFAQLMRLDDAALVEVFQRMEPRYLLIALAGVDARLVNQMLQMLPRRQAQLVRERMDGIGPLQLADIRRAQVSFARLASEVLEARSKQTSKKRRFRRVA